MRALTGESYQLAKDFECVGRNLLLSVGVCAATLTSVPAVMLPPLDFRFPALGICAGSGRDMSHDRASHARKSDDSVKSRRVDYHDNASACM